MLLLIMKLSYLKVHRHHLKLQKVCLLFQKNVFKQERSYSSQELQECVQWVCTRQVALCMDHCYAAELTGDDAWFKTVVLSGGSACLPGLAERLEKELNGLLPSSVSNGIRVIPPPFGADSAWFGAKLISNLSTFPGPWCMTKRQFRQKSRLNLIW
ncbi:hypothetical protein L1049_000484 [Liquidambar formosana]|uniref:Actin-related protein 8 n=1 Tax=Liquidambar formosana TaxID=63359 RepID=A0AAP0R5E2_LIQFO